MGNPVSILRVGEIFHIHGDAVDVEAGHSSRAYVSVGMDGTCPAPFAVSTCEASLPPDRVTPLNSTIQSNPIPTNQHRRPRHACYCEQCFLNKNQQNYR